MGEKLAGAVELAARKAWQRALGVEDIAPDDDFFELGGHSLSAMRVISMVRDDISTDVAVTVLLDNPEFADFVRGVTEHVAASR